MEATGKGRRTVPWQAHEYALVNGHKCVYEIVGKNKTVEILLPGALQVAIRSGDTRQQIEQRNAELRDQTKRFRATPAQLRAEGFSVEIPENKNLRRAGEEFA